MASSTLESRHTELDQLVLPLEAGDLFVYHDAALNFTDRSCLVVESVFDDDDEDEAHGCFIHIIFLKDGRFCRHNYSHHFIETWIIKCSSISSAAAAD